MGRKGHSGKDLGAKQIHICLWMMKDFMFHTRAALKITTSMDKCEVLPGGLGWLITLRYHCQIPSSKEADCFIFCLEKEGK